MSPRSRPMRVNSELVQGGISASISSGAGAASIHQKLQLFIFKEFIYGHLNESSQRKRQKTSGGSEMKLKKTFLIFLVLYLLALILAGANRMRSPDAVLTKILAFIWSLAPSQTARWFGISLIVLVILLVLIFAAGCILIARLETARAKIHLTPSASIFIRKKQFTYLIF